MARLSVIVIARDEERMLPALLSSVDGLADEVLVIDSGSTDRTVEVARIHGARVLHHDWVGYGPQRRFATAQARNDHVLSLDADERVTPELASAIKAELEKPDDELAAGYRIQFRHLAFGRIARFGAMWRDRRLRLFDRRRGGYDAAPVHERIAVDGPVRNLGGHCDHVGYRDLGEARAKMARYAELAARERYRKGARWHPWHLLRFPLGFLKRYLLWFGLLDGRVGAQLALLYARYDLDKALWLRRLEREIGGKRGRGALSSLLREGARRATVRLVSFLLPVPREKLPAPADIRRLLVVRSDERVGDQLLTTPLLRALAQGLPQAEIHLLAAARQSSLVATPHIRRVIPFEKRTAFRRPWRLFAFLRALRREQYDVVVEAGHWSGFSLTASLLARVAGGKGAVVGHLRGDSARFLSHPVAHDPAIANEVRSKLELLRPLGLLPCGLAPETELGKDPAGWQSLIAWARANSPYAVLNPGARMADRRWSPSAHGAVARGLLARGLKVLVVWGPGEEPIARAVAEGTGAQLAPATNLAQLATLLRHARICVSNNSGPMHLSVAVGTPTVGVFLREDSRRWGHELPFFQAAEPRGESDSQTVLSACDRLLDIDHAGMALGLPGDA